VEESTSDDSRWEQIMEVQEDNLVLLPDLVNREDSTPRQPSERTVRFAEALVFEDAWTGITEARNKDQRRRAA